MPTVRDIMTSNTVTISPASPIHVAVDLLLEKRISGLPVVDEAGRLVGILTEFALLFDVQTEYEIYLPSIRVHRLHLTFSTSIRCLLA